MKVQATLLVLALLAACGEPDIILPGQRFEVRPTEAVVNRAAPLALPAAQVNAEWTQRGGGPAHRITHPALGASLTQVFAVDIGEGDSRRARITADPVVAGGVIYTLDARAQVTATTTAGARLWTASVAPRTDNTTDGSGGGIAAADGVVYVTTGYGTLVALDAATGGQFWEQDLDAPGTSAPTVLGDLVYVVSRDSTAWAIERETGRIRWQASGTRSVGNFAGGAGAATDGNTVVFPFSSGEVLGAFAQGGLQRWSSVVTGGRAGAAVATLTDIASDPVIVGDTVYVGNFAGQIAALSLASGERVWTVPDGAVSPVWPVGGALFAVNDRAELLRLDAGDGSVVWRVALPAFVQTRGVRRSQHAHYGPVLAGGRLIVASSDGLLRSFDPVSGNLVGQVALPGGAASHPVVAGNTLYVVTKAGQLVAFR